MKDLDKYIEKIKKLANNSVEMTTKHRFILLFIILGTAVGFALIRTSAFKDIPRNEQRYTDESLKIKYQQIDKQVLDSFADKQQDTNVEVGSQYDPTRVNPFVD